MAMITCSECGKEFSDKAPSCPNCGCPTEQATGSSSKDIPRQVESNQPWEKQTGNSGKIKCPRCGSTNVKLTLTEVGDVSLSRTKGKIKPVRGKAKYKQRNIGVNNSLHGTMALCKDCGRSWRVSQLTDKQRKFYKRYFIIMAFVFIIIFMMISVGKSDEVQNDIDNFSYDIEGKELVLNDYNGSASELRIKNEYEIDGKSYEVNDLLNFQVSRSSVKTLIIEDGITELNNSIFNGCDVDTIYLPKSLTVIYDDTLAYLSAEHIDLYYEGSKKQWKKIFKKYEASSVSEEIDNENYEGAGKAAADKINSLVGHELDRSKFTMHYASEIPSE